MLITRDFTTCSAWESKKSGKNCLMDFSLTKRSKRSLKIYHVLKKSTKFKNLINQRDPTKRENLAIRLRLNLKRKGLWKQSRHYQIPSECKKKLLPLFSKNKNYNLFASEKSKIFQRKLKSTCSIYLQMKIGISLLC